MVDLAQLPGFEWCGCKAFDLLVDAAPSAVNPHLRRRGEVRQGRVERIGKFRVDDEVFSRSRLNAVREGLPGEVGVKQRDDSAHAGDTQPDRQILGAIGHQQADHIALGHALCDRPAGVPPRALREFEVGEALAVGEQRGLVA